MTIHDYTFRSVGSPYPLPDRKIIADDYLHSAQRAELFLDHNRRDLKEGVHWVGAESDDTDVTWYAGTAGIMYYYLHAYAATDDSDDKQRYLRLVEESARYLANRWHDLLDVPLTRFASAMKHNPAAGYYHGIGGVGALLLEVYKVLNDESIAQTTREIANWYVRHVKHDEHGAYWSGIPASICDGGVILYLIEQAETVGDDDGVLRQLIVEAGDRLLSYGEGTRSGGLRFDAVRVGLYQPSFEFGTAGAGFILSELYRFTSDDKYLEAAKRAGTHLNSLFVEQPNGGVLIPWGFGPDGKAVSGEDGKTLQYLGVCLGVAGIEKYYYKMYLTTHEQHYLDDARRLAKGLLSTGAPLRQTNGLWNSVCYCCGHAGILHVFAGLYEATGDTVYRRIAMGAADVLFGWGESLPDGSEDWPIAYLRVKPDVISRKIGYWDGAAGIAAALRQAYYLETGKGVVLRLRDDPFPVIGVSGLRGGR